MTKIMGRKETYWHKSNVFNSLRKWMELTSCKSSIWILKSPTQIRSILAEIWNSSRDSNSVKNVDMDDEGGW